MSDGAKIDVSEILKSLGEEVTTGLREKRLTLTDISIMMTEAMGKTREKILEDIETIVKAEQQSEDGEDCEICGNALKKTTKKTKPKPSKHPAEI